MSVGAYNFNYSVLSDSEFEELCLDILNAKTNYNFRSYAKGRDGGVDLSASTIDGEIIAQVKHYSKSSFSHIYNSLKKEKSLLK